MEIRVRPMAVDDAVAVTALYTQLGYPAPTEEMERRIARLAGSGDHVALVAEDSAGLVIGCIQVQGRHLLEYRPFAEIAGVVVDEACRGQGVGRALLAGAEAWARARGYAQVLVRSNTLRTRAHHFYEREGYRADKSQYVFSKELLTARRES